MKNLLSLMKLLLTLPKNAGEAAGFIVLWFLIVALGVTATLGVQRAAELITDRQHQLELRNEK